MQRVTAAQWRTLNWLVRWLIMVRAPVLVMTLSSGLAGVLLALQVGSVSWPMAVVILLGLTFAHATNNLLNDWVDHATGVDKGNYFRQRYGTHVLEDLLVTKKNMALVILGTASIAAAAGVYLMLVSPVATNVMLLTAIGAVFVLFYTWPLKHLALGELSVLLVWGPLMTAGTFYVLTETISLEVLLVSLLAGIGPTLVIFGKHIDKIADDTNKGVNTLPVVLGMKRSLLVTRLLLGWLAVCLLLAILVFEFYALAVCLLAVPRAWQLNQVLARPAPRDKPAAYPETIWPLWYSASAFGFVRVFGVTLLVGLGLQLLMPILV
jgi:1,4-dihydroxy-2-naphthoate octaprenyltransferase